MLGSLLLVCIASVAPAAPIGRAASPVTLTFWQSNNPQEARFTKALVDRWNKAHRDIQIKLQYIPAGKSTEEVLAAAIAAHKTPDITNNLLPAVVPQYSGQGGLYQLDKLPDCVSYVKARMPQRMLERPQEHHHFRH
jgi:multiple sugar transport system substrate-binding protein